MPLQWLQVVVIGLICINCHFSYAQTDQDLKIQYKFAHNKTKYSIQASFSSPLVMSEILNRLFDYHHVKEFTKSVDSVQLIDKGVGWNRITFRQCELFGCIETTYLRKVQKNSWRITFVQEESHISGNFLIPQVITNSGYYQIKSYNNGSLVEYFQAVELEESILSTIFQRHARSSTINFIQDLSEYLQNSQ